MVSIITRTAQDDDLKLTEAKGLLNVLSNYTQSYILLRKNKHRLNSDGHVKINEYALVTLALLVAQSDIERSEIIEPKKIGITALKLL